MPNLCRREADLSDLVEYDQFVSELRKVIVQGMDLSENARIREDLGFDSMDTYELILIVEGMGFEVGEEDVLGWESLGDIYHWMLRYRN